MGMTNKKLIAELVDSFVAALRSGNEAISLTNELKGVFMASGQVTESMAGLMAVSVYTLAQEKNCGRQLVSNINRDEIAAVLRLA